MVSASGAGGGAVGAFFRPTPMLLGSRLTGVPFWRRRPESLFRAGAPQTVSRHFLYSKFRRMSEPDDPTRTMPMSSVVLMRCPNCKRVKAVNSDRAGYFHSCCEIHEMQLCTDLHPKQPSLKRAMHLHGRLTNAVRKWDFAKSRPKSNPHKPHNRSHSKLPK